MKPWYTSKTLWLNAIAVLALIIQSQANFVIDVEAQAGLLAFINLVLRLITKEPINWTGTSTDSASTNNQAGFASLPLLLGMGLLCLALAGCASIAPPAGDYKDAPLQTAGKSLLAAKSTITTAATTVDNLCKLHVLDTGTCSQARIAYDMSKPAYNSAVDAYLLLSQGGDPADFAASLKRLQDIAANLLKLTVTATGGAH